MDQKSNKYFKELMKELGRKKYTKHTLNTLKMKLCEKHKLKNIPTDIQILLNVDKKKLNKFNLKLLQTKPTRSISGVAVCAVMSFPYKCPHGECRMCPSNTSKGIPQSYTGKEPASMRAIRNKFDSYLQVFNRLEQYVVMGHNFDKIEVIIMGGTFPSFPKKYQENFVMNAFKAMNDFGKLFFVNNEFNVSKFKKFFELPGEVGSEKRVKSIHKKILKLKGKSTLEKEQRMNEKSMVRCVGMTQETRPDYGMLKHANEMLRLGCTRVELGVQTVYNEVLERIERGHSVEDSINSIRILKDLGFKINYHVMPGLPDVDKKKDIEGLKKLFTDQRFRPDMLKIYPCMVLKNTKLFRDWKKGKFDPLTTKKAAELVAEFKKYVPEYVRIMRVQRDIPTYMTEAGVDKTNLRQYVDKLKPKCKCIRCREIGRFIGKKNFKLGKISVNIKEYKASDGKEFFISADDKNMLLGFCRLRFPSQLLRKEITKKTALVRELHIYSPAVNIGEKSKDSFQHKGLGKKLLKKAEEIAKKNGKKKIVIISGVGARDYYRKLGYKNQGPYMVKKL